MISRRTCRHFYAIDIKPHEFHNKLQNYIYLLTCKHCGIQCLNESITPFNLRTEIHWRELKLIKELKFINYCVCASTKNFTIARFFQIFSTVCFWMNWQSFFYENFRLIFCSASNQYQLHPPGQADLKPENKSLLPAFGESFFLTSMITIHGWKLFCLRRNRWETCWKRW